MKKKTKEVIKCLKFKILKKNVSLPKYFKNNIFR